MDDLREFHEQLLEILLEFDRICRKHGIKYSLGYGTLLGAIRNSGFIPWDDDVDVLMERSQFERFCEVCPNEVGERFFFQSKETEKSYPYNICRLRKNKTAMIFNEWRDAGIHLGIYIDIYPVDHIPNNAIQRGIQSFFIILLTPVRVSRNRVIYMNGGAERFGKLVFAIKNVMYWLAKLVPSAICDKLETYFVTKYNGVPCEKSGVICEGACLLNPDSTNRPFDSEYLAEYREIDFEGNKLMCVKNAESLLEFWYGDYMKLPPVEQRVMYHHPDVFDTKRSYKEYL